MASMKVTQVRPPPVGAANPRVVTDEPLISNERVHVPEPNPQKMREKAKMIEIIHTRGRLTRATGA